MQNKLIVRILLIAMIAVVSILPGGVGFAASPSTESTSEAPPVNGYAVEFVSTAATGASINDAGIVIGTSYPDPGCGPFCLPTQETVVWRDSERIVLPTVPGLTGITVRNINAQGWIVGYAGLDGTTTHAVVWKPEGNAYQALDIGTLPGTTVSYAVGIDDLGRVIGWSTTLNFPPTGSPFMWTEAEGMIDLSAQGYPDEAPLAISPNGAVATPGYWYRLADPASVVVMPSVPQGFYPPGTYGTAINDAGDQARFLIATGGENLAYLFRFHHEGTWQQISTDGNGQLLPFGVGSINAAGDLTATIQGSGVIAFGPDGVTQPLSPMISPAYPGASVTTGGPMNSSGQILAKVMVGQSARLVRLTPAQDCTTGCIRVNYVRLNAKFIQDPQYPGLCFENGNMYNRTRVSLYITNENGKPLQGVMVSGRFLDDYWTNTPVSGLTNKLGMFSYTYTGLCGVGAIAFFVDSAVKNNLILDETSGVLSGYAIPK